MSNIPELLNLPEDDENAIFAESIINALIKRTQKKDWYDLTRSPVMVAYVLSDHAMVDCKSSLELYSFIATDLNDKMLALAWNMPKEGEYAPPAILGPIKRMDLALNMYVIIAFPKKG